MLILFLLQMNANAFLQTIGLVFIQAIIQAPIYFLAVYWAVTFANKRVEMKLQNKTQMENK